MDKNDPVKIGSNVTLTRHDWFNSQSHTFPESVALVGSWRVGIISGNMISLITPVFVGTESVVPESVVPESVVPESVVPVFVVHVLVDPSS